MAKRKKALIKTDVERLERLPQFQPDRNFPIDHLDFETGQSRPFTRERDKQIREILASAIEPHLRHVNWQGAPTSLDRFLNSAMHATAVYLHQKNSLPTFSRVEATKCLRATVESICSARERLEAMATRPELASFVERIFLEIWKRDRPEDSDKKRLKPLSVKESIREAKWRDKIKEKFRDTGPQAIARRLRELEPILTLAAERTEFQPGSSTQVPS